MGVLGSIFLGTYMAVGGGKKTSMSNNIPPINASNKDEEGFIQYVKTQKNLETNAYNC